MKTVFLVIGVIAGILFLSSSSCDHKKAIESLDQKYEGTWKYIGYSGGYAGFSFKKDTLHQKLLQIKDTSYVRLNNGEKHCGTYKVVSEIKYGYVPGPYLIFDQNEKGPAIKVKNDTLILTQPVADGMSDWYVKKDTVLQPCSDTESF